LRCNQLILCGGPVATTSFCGFIKITVGFASFFMKPTKFENSLIVGGRQLFIEEERRE